MRVHVNGVCLMLVSDRRHLHFPSACVLHVTCWEHIYLQNYSLFLTKIIFGILYAVSTSAVFVFNAYVYVYLI